MTAQPEDPGPPVLPQPSMTHEALRAAVRQLDLTRLPEFDRDLGQAFDQAVQLSSTTPMRLFLEKWATIVAILRHPDRARRLSEAEKALADPGIPHDAFQKARETITSVLDLASREVLGGAAR